MDSYPDKQFRGVVSEVQLNPVVNQNVVTYNVVMEVDNEPRGGAAEAPEGQGRPGGWRGGDKAPQGPRAGGAQPAQTHQGEFRHAKAVPAANSFSTAA